jgi:hypothetical protein
MLPEGKSVREPARKTPGITRVSRGRLSYCRQAVPGLLRGTSAGSRGKAGRLKGVSQQFLTELNTFDSRMEETSNVVFLYFYATCSLEWGHSLGSRSDKSSKL